MVLLGACPAQNRHRHSADFLDTRKSFDASTYAYACTTGLRNAMIAYSDFNIFEWFLWKYYSRYFQVCLRKKKTNFDEDDDDSNNKVMINDSFDDPYLIHGLLRTEIMSLWKRGNLALPGRIARFQTRLVSSRSLIKHKGIEFFFCFGTSASSSAP